MAAAALTGVGARSETRGWAVSIAAVLRQSTETVSSHLQPYLTSRGRAKLLKSKWRPVGHCSFPNNSVERRAHVFWEQHGIMHNE